MFLLIFLDVASYLPGYRLGALFSVSHLLMLVLTFPKEVFKAAHVCLCQSCPIIVEGLRSLAVVSMWYYNKYYMLVCGGQALGNP